MNDLLEKQNRKLSWGIYSFALIISCLIIQIAKWTLLPTFLDIYYHLSVMLGFDRAGGLVTTAFWENAPVGRPHLYPPLLHILMLGFYKLGLDKLSIARLFSSLMFPLTLLAIWVFCQKLFTKRIAFFSVLLASSSYYFYLETTNIVAFSLAMIFCLLGIIALEKNKNIAFVLLLTACFFTHTQVGWFFLFSILIYGLFNKKIFSYSFKMLFAFLLYLPFLLHQAYNLKHFSFVNLNAMSYIDFNVFIYIFAIIGIFICIKRKGIYNIPVSLLIGFSPLIFTYPQRFISGHLFIVFIFFAAILLDRIFEILQLRLENKTWIFLIIVLVFFHFASLNIRLLPQRKVYLERSYSVFSEFTSPQIDRHRPTDINIFMPKFVNPIVDIVKNNSSDHDIVFSNYEYFAGMLSVFADRAISCSMLPEVSPYHKFDKISVSRIVIWLKEFDKDDKLIFPIVLNGIIKKYNLNLIAETQIAYVYLNPDTKAVLKVPRPFIDNCILFSILFTFIGLVIFDLVILKNIRKKLTLL